MQDNVANATDKAKGFVDGNAGTAIDYTYDPNGNMTHDLNKGIGTGIADAANIITYNFLNLPVTVTKGGNSIRYVYDATGQNLSQVTTFSGTAKRTDYAGEFIFENDALQFINHEEGRIAMAGNKLIYPNSCDAVTGLTAVTSSLAPFSNTNNGENYIKVTSSGTAARTGIFPAGGTFTVVAGERYRIRARGYRGTNPVYLEIKTNGSDLDWPGASLPNSAATESWIEQIVTIPAGKTTLQAGVAWNTTVSNGEIFYLNDFEITQLTTVAPEYQYHLKDHLGNVRLTFTTKTPNTTNYTATFETATQTVEQSTFQNYTSTTFDLVDHTDAAGTVYQKVQFLNGGVNGRVGLAKTISVMPGDEISITAFGKYMNLGTTSNTNAFITSLASAFGVSSGSTGEQLKIYNGLNSYAVTVPAGDHPADNESAPKAFVTIVFFDKNYNFLDAAYNQMTTVGAQTSASVKQPPHCQLSKTVKAPGAGYAYVFLSNEHPYFVDVYFDDVTLAVTPSAIVSSNDYYPFGLTFNSFSRENSVLQNYQYNGKEVQDELNLGWLDYGARMYIPEIGRWGVIDPKGAAYFEWSPYNYVGDNPIKRIDPNGMEWANTHAKNEASKMARGVIKVNEKLEAKNEKLAHKYVNAVLGGRSGKAERILSRMIDNKARINQNHNTMDALQQMGTVKGIKFDFSRSAQTYEKTDPATGQATTYRTTTVSRAADGTYIINNSGGLANQAHEAIHGGQVAGGLVEIRSGGTDITKRDPSVSSNTALEPPGYRSHYGISGSLSFPHTTLTDPKFDEKVVDHIRHSKQESGK